MTRRKIIKRCDFMTTTIIEKLIIMHELTKKELSECMGITLKSLEDKLK